MSLFFKLQSKNDCEAKSLDICRVLCDCDIFHCQASGSVAPAEVVLSFTSQNGKLWCYSDEDFGISDVTSTALTPPFLQDICTAVELFYHATFRYEIEDNNNNNNNDDDDDDEDTTITFYETDETEKCSCEKQ